MTYVLFALALGLGVSGTGTAAFGSPSPGARPFPLDVGRFPVFRLLRELDRRVRVILVVVPEHRPHEQASRRLQGLR